ncbi:ABC transporter, substrate binding protein, possibly oligopeptides [Prochlorococcus marinus str. MIT 9515]|uniref:ABC transporter, substrate binding protein, possibly oligopeptides n=1 Tax=Prochlorococcus marinus (strain MIT 9515) TaxID=167542 RepID=A2BX36_PROM5|nr:ABC transporter substrate-binding protein [Prochlorococcus marinus]ABM72347.1 ABC transporter, substrate binding protein, possibly oligopeptides [Prochlorococcus marinus str. MIT 9515]
MQNNFLVTTFLFFISLSQFSCVPDSRPKRITIASSGKIESLDPARASTLKSIQLLSSLGDTLYELNSKGELIPELASGMPIFSKDKLKITINLRRNVLFHDGTLFNSNALKFSFDRFKRIGTMNYILGNKIQSIETPSEYKVVINLTKPSSSINGLLTAVYLTPISPTFYKDYSDKFLNDQFVGTGKYILKRFSNEVQIIDPNLNHWGNKPNNEGVNFIGYSNSSSLFGALKSKQIDVLLSNSIDDSQRNNLNSLSKKNEIKEGNSPATEISFISLRTNSYPLNNLNVRLAIAKSLNRKLISDKVSYGLREPLRSIVPPILKKNKQELWPEYNPVEAKNLLQKEGFCNGNILELPLTFRSNVPADRLIALSWQEEIKNILNECISIQLNGVESTTIYKNLNLGLYTAVILDWTGAYSDPEAYLTPLLSCSELDGEKCKKGESVYSGSFWGSRIVDDLFLESEKLNGDERLAKLIEIEKIASESIPYIPIWISSQKAWSQNKVSKPIFNGAGIISISDLKFINE